MLETCGSRTPFFMAAPDDAGRMTGKPDCDLKAVGMIV
jgi:hypothetical protein